MHAVAARRGSHRENTRHVTRVRIGLLSTASINGAILGARSAEAPFSVDAVGSRDAARAQAYAGEHGIARAHGSYEELLADVELDAVYIALPNALHHEWAMRALAAGKHVLCEKPYTRAARQVDEAWDEAERRGLVLTEGYMWRHAAQTQLLRELLPAGGGGTRRRRRLHRDARPRADDPRWDAGLGGGALLDLGCYCVSAARLVLGEPDDAHGAARLRDEVDEHFAGVLRFGDVFATFQCGFTSALVNRIEVIGSSGVLEVPQAFVDPPGVVLLDGDEHRVEAGDHYRAELDDFCAAIRGERRALIDRLEMRGQAAALAVLLAGSSSRAV